MLEFDFERLAALGLTSALASRAALLEGGVDAAGESHPQRLLRITEVHRETVVLHDGRAELSARVLPRLVRSLMEEGTALAVGDWVLARVDPHGDCWVTQRVPPTSHIARRDAEGSIHPVVSNVDIALLVMGLDDDFNPRRLERFLALLHDDAIVPVVVLTKVDVAPLTPEELEARMSILRDRVPSHVDRFAVNATDATAAHALRDYLVRGPDARDARVVGRGQVDADQYAARARTSRTPVRSARTTDAASTRRLRDRSTGCPAARASSTRPVCVRCVPKATRRRWPKASPTSTSLAAQCRFRDCSHGFEPGCAVREGVDADRLRNYQKLLRELRRDTLTPLDRRKQVALWKARGKAAKARMRQKRGELGSE